MNTDVLMQGLKLGGFFWVIFGLPPFLTAIILKIRDAATYDRLSGTVTGKKKKHLILYALLSFAASVPGALILGLCFTYNVLNEDNIHGNKLIVILALELLCAAVIIFAQPVTCLNFGTLDRKYRGEVEPPVPGKAISTATAHNFFLALLPSLSFVLVLVTSISIASVRSASAPIFYIAVPILSVAAAIWIKNVLSASIEKKYGSSVS